MTARERCYLDRNRVGEGLLLNEDDLSFTTSVDCDFNRKIIGTLPVMSGNYALELYFYSTSQDDLSSLTSFGVAYDDGTRLDTYVGAETQSYGMLCADGVIRNNDSDVATFTPIPERTAVGLELSLDPVSPNIKFFRNGAMVAALSGLPVGKAWYPCFSIGSNSPGDVSCQVNFGQYRFDKIKVWRDGWSTQRAGLNTIYVGMVQEAFHTLPTDTPANTPFGPFVIGADKVFVKRSPRPWHLRDSDGDGSSSLSMVVLDNSSGQFNALASLDARDSKFVLQRVSSPGGVAGSLSAARTILTGVIDKVRKSGGLIQITLRDSLSRFDRPMKMRRIPKFWDASSAGAVMPWGRGAMRNIRPRLLSEPDRLYLLNDGPVTNITLVSDKGAPLDPNSLPPQYTPALDHEGLQTEVLPEGRLAVDCSTVGPQYEIPGAQDVIAGIGDFSTWAVTANTQTSTPPSGWDFSNNASSYMLRYVASATNVMRLKTVVPWYPEHPTTPKYGDWIKLHTPPLLGGRSYRIKVGLLQAQSDVFLPGGPRRQGGFMLRTALSNDPADAITAHGIAINTNGMTSNGFGEYYTIDFTVPLGPARPVYLICTASSGNTAGSANGIAFMDVHNVQIELLGQFVSLPLSDARPQDVMYDVIVDAEGESSASYSAADLAALYASAGHGVSVRFEDTPNIRTDIIEAIADAYNAIYYTDADDMIRFAKWYMPDDPSAPAPVARFTAANVDVDTIEEDPVAAESFTTQFWLRRNVEPFGDGDFVTDTDIVTATIRAAYTGVGQQKYSSPIKPAQEYAKREGAERRLIPIDDIDAAKASVNEAAKQMTVKRKAVRFKAFYDGGSDTIGDGITCDPLTIYPGMIVVLHVPEKGYDELAVTIADTEAYDADGRLIIIGIF